LRASRTAYWIDLPWIKFPSKGYEKRLLEIRRQKQI
jgi:hypothetical protein